MQDIRPFWGKPSGASATYHTFKKLLSNICLADSMPVEKLISAAWTRHVSSSSHQIWCRYGIFIETGDIDISRNSIWRDRHIGLSC